MRSELFSLAGQTALITGSTSGIGLVIAQGMARAGARVVLHGRDEERLSAARSSFGDWEVGGVLFDVTQPHEVEAGVARVEADIGPIHILVNNAGMQHRQTLVDFDVSSWDQLIATNLTSAFLVGRAVARGMIARRDGRVINICSVMSEVGRKTIGPYTAAKGGLRQLTKAMAIEWAEHNVRVNGIGPGYFLTKLNTALSEDTTFNTWLQNRTPLGRWGDVDELVGPAVFLASEASSFMTGQILYVDGGMLASV